MSSLWSANRFSNAPPSPGTSGDPRTAFEKDYDRILFSTPVRRLADKTQVFPLERNDSVRNRLTHSMEVSNIARSLGNRIIKQFPEDFGENKQNVPVVLAAAGLAHDMGNPPFGHRGESAISDWFARNAEKVGLGSVGLPTVESPNDFLKFEGNAQTLRLATRLQASVGGNGLDLTACTLAAMMKYTAQSDKTDKANASSKKFGFFKSEEPVVEWIRKETGLAEGQRHPLAAVMEAADDVAYNVLDVEDAMTKGLVSPEDVRNTLRQKFGSEHDLTKRINESFEKAEQVKDRGVGFIREIKAAYLRTTLIDFLIGEVIRAFGGSRTEIMDGSAVKSLLGEGDGASLCKVLGTLAKEHAYLSVPVLGLEYSGSKMISATMDAMWEAITDGEDPKEALSRRKSAKGAFVFSLISDSYKRQFAIDVARKKCSARYCELRLLADMMSGMTDGYAVDVYQKIKSYECY